MNCHFSLTILLSFGCELLLGLMNFGRPLAHNRLETAHKPRGQPSDTSDANLGHNLISFRTKYRVFIQHNDIEENNLRGNITLIPVQTSY